MQLKILSLSKAIDNPNPTGVSEQEAAKQACWDATRTHPADLTAAINVLPISSQDRLIGDAMIQTLRVWLISTLDRIDEQDGVRGGAKC